MISRGSYHITPGLGHAAQPFRGLCAGRSHAFREVDSGRFQVNGDTARKSAPDQPEVPVGPRRVRLHDQPSGRVVAEMWSDPVTGSYAFTHIRSGVFYITAFDHVGADNGVIQSDVTSEPMP